VSVVGRVIMAVRFSIMPFLLSNRLFIYSYADF
jgi:hypothetical protein